MLSAYIDDSVSDVLDDKRLVLAGYVHTPEAWTRFSRDWAAVLSDPPKLKTLHMSGGFHGLSKSEQRHKIDALAEVIKRYRPASFDVSLSRADYQRIVRPQAPYDLRHAFFPGFVGVMHGLAKTILAEGLAGPVELTFDEQGNVGSNAALWYLPIKHSFPELAAVLGGPPTFRSDEDVIPLQAADMLAWHMRRCLEPSHSPRHREVADAIRFSHYSFKVPLDMVERWAVAFSSVPGIELARGKRGSAKKVVGELIAKVPPEQLPKVMRGIEHRQQGLDWIEKVLARTGLRHVLKWLGRFKRH